MFESSKLHPVTYITKIVKAIKDHLFSIGIALFITFKNGFDFSDWGQYIIPGLLLLITVVSIVTAVINASRTTYWIEDDKLVIKSGLFTTTIKELYISRIQSIEVTKSVVNQLLGGVILDVKTPGDGINLDSIAEQSARDLTTYLETRQQILLNENRAIIDESDEFVTQQEPRTFREVYQLKAKDILLMSVTSGAMGTVLAVSLGFYSQLDEVLNLNNRIKPIEKLEAHSMIWLVSIIIAVLLSSYIIGIFVTALKYYHYQLTYDGERLKITHGLFERKEKIVVVEQIQAVSEEKSFIRQLLGYTSFKATITSDAENIEEMLGTVEILPFIKRHEGLEVMRYLVPGYYYTEVDKIIPQRALRRYAQFHWLSIMVVTGIVQYYVFDKAWLIGLILLAVTGLSAWMRYKFSGYTIEHDQITLRTVGLLSSTTAMIKEDKLLGVTIQDNFFLSKAHLAHVEVKNSAGAINASHALKMIDRKDAERIYAWFMRMERSEYDSR